MIYISGRSVSAQWKRLPSGSELPPPRAYHSLTCVGSRFLLFGGFDGKTTFGDLWWLVPEGTSLFHKLFLSNHMQQIHQVSFVF